MPRFTLNIHFQRFLSVCFCLDKCGQAMVDRMDLSSEDALIDFVNALDFFKMCLPCKTWGFSWHWPPTRQFNHFDEKTLYSIPLIMQE